MNWEKDSELAEAIIAEYADADMSEEELTELLVQNGIEQPHAEVLAKDMRGG